MGLREPAHGLPTLAKEHAWHHAHSQFEDRSRGWVPPELCLSCVALPDVTAVTAGSRRLIVISCIRAQLS